MLHYSLNATYVLFIHFRVKYVQVASTKYMKEDIVVLSKEEDDPILGRIVQILITPDDQCVFIAQCLTVAFYAHYHAYQIVGTADTIVTTPNRLHSHQPLNTHTCFCASLSTSQFVCLKYHVL